MAWPKGKPRTNRLVPVNATPTIEADVPVEQEGDAWDRPEEWLVTGCAAHRAALVETLRRRLVGEALTPYLSMNDRINITQGQNFRRAQAKLHESGSLDNAQAVAEEFVPPVEAA